jgi:hypothetical protein
VHPFVAAILIGTAWQDPLWTDPEANPPTASRDKPPGASVGPV